VKNVWLIWAFYCLLLNFLPCGENECGNYDTHARQETGAARHDDAQHQDDSCSPFCACTCCQLTFTQTLFDAGVDAPLNLPALRRYAQPVSNGYRSWALNTIWQPPRNRA
jgi:hypothetical protein